MQSKRTLASRLSSFPLRAPTGAHGEPLHRESAWRHSIRVSLIILNGNMHRKISTVRACIESRNACPIVQLRGHDLLSPWCVFTRKTNLRCLEANLLFDPFSNYSHD